MGVGWSKGLARGAAVLEFGALTERRYAYVYTYFWQRLAEGVGVHVVLRVRRVVARGEGRRHTE